MVALVNQLNKPKLGNAVTKAVAPLKPATVATPATQQVTAPAASTSNPTAPKLDQSQLDYFSKNYGGIDNYATAQNEKYQNGDADMKAKVLADAMRVGYSVKGTAAAEKPAALTYDSALAQANSQLDPTYQRAVQNVYVGQHQNQLNAGELASAQGGAHSGLSADLQNKVNLAAASEVGDLDAKRASQAAEMAQALLQRDQDTTFRNRQQDFTEWQGKESLGLSRDQFNRGIVESDRGYDRGVLESDRDYNRGVTESDRSYEYQQGRDATTDKQWQEQFDEDTRRYGLDYALSKASTNANIAQGWAGIALDKDKFNYSKSQDAAAAKAAGGSSAGVIRDVNLPTTVGTMETYIKNKLPGGPTVAGPPSPHQLQTIENMILSNPNLSEKDVITLYKKYGISVPQ